MSEMLLTAYNGAILGPIAKLLGWIMNGMYILMEKVGISNVGLSIILFTIVIYALMFPLTYKQQKFSKLSQKMNPELQAVQKKYKDKKDTVSMQNMQAETQQIYGEVWCFTDRQLCADVNSDAFTFGVVPCIYECSCLYQQCEGCLS